MIAFFTIDLSKVYNVLPCHFAHLPTINRANMQTAFVALLQLKIDTLEVILQTLWTKIRLLPQEQCDLGSYYFMIKSSRTCEFQYMQQTSKAEDNFRGRLTGNGLFAFL